MLSFAEFSKQLLDTGDLDPEYIFMNNVSVRLRLSEVQLADWVVLKSLIYRSESELSFLLGYEKDIIKLKLGDVRRKSKAQIPEYYKAFRTIILQQGDSSFTYLQSLPRNASHAMTILQQIKGVGPWAAWKILDLASCCMGIKFDFSKVNFPDTYEYPLKGVLMVAGESEKNITALRNDPMYYRWVYVRAIKYLEPCMTMLAPPQRERVINIQEIETCFCKYHSYVHNKYYVGQDTEHLRKEIRESRHEQIRALGDCI